jgi:hypothetical protein
MAVVEQGMHEPVIVCDIDDTVFKEHEDYAPIQNVIDFLIQQAQTKKIIMLTARLESEREFTVNQLRKVGIPFSDLIMEQFIDPNHEGSTTEQHAIYKAEKVRTIMSKYRVILFIDNSKPARQAVKKLGVLTKKPENISNKILTKTVWSGIFI